MQALVLLVEEDRMMRKTISDMLEAMECRVWVNALERARRVMSAIAFDVIIGNAWSSTSLELSYAAAAKTMQSNIRLILVCADSLSQCLSASVNAFVVKPLLLESLGDALKAVLRKLH